MDLVHVLNYMAGRASEPSWQLFSVSIFVEGLLNDFDDIPLLVVFERALMNFLEILVRGLKLQRIRLHTGVDLSTDVLASMASFFQRGNAMLSVDISVPSGLINQQFLHTMQSANYVRNANGIWNRSAAQHPAHSTMSMQPLNVLVPNVFETHVSQLHQDEDENTAEVITEESFEENMGVQVNDCDDVVQHVTHDEPPRSISSWEAREITGSLWASSHQDMAARILRQNRVTSGESLDDVVGLFFNRYSDDFAKAVENSPPALALQAQAVRPLRDSGPFILVEPFTLGDAAEFRCVLEGRLGAQYVFVKRSDVRDLLTAVQLIKDYRQRPTVERVMVYRAPPADDSISWFQGSDVTSLGIAWEDHTARTFLHFAAAPRPRGRRSLSV